MGAEKQGEQDAGLNRKRLYAVLRMPLFFATGNYFLLNTIFVFLPYRLGEALYTAGRIFVIGYAGWLICRRGIGGIRQAALVGAGIYFFDHVVLKGGVFILNYLLRPEGMGFAAFGSVVISFVFFAPLAMAVSALGGSLALRQGSRSAGDAA